MEVKEVRLAQLIPYENNPRKNDRAVEYVMNSIKEFGFQVPIVVDKNNVIIAGHTRAKAGKRLGLEYVPVVVADDLTEEQVRAFRIADNSTGEEASWDWDKLEIELDAIADINMEDFGVDILTDSFSVLEEAGYGVNVQETSTFELSFVIPKEHETVVKGYVAKKGRNELIDLIVQKCEEDYYNAY